MQKKYVEHNGQVYMLLPLEGKISGSSTICFLFFFELRSFLNVKV